ncbi:MAG: hypothetical protein AAF662_03600 [Pseudomonadota bacterium]
MSASRKTVINTRFFMLSALFSFYLLVDDAFLLHKFLLPAYLGWSESVVILTIVVAATAYFALFLRAILRTRYVLLVLSLAFLASSVAIDELFREHFGNNRWWLYFLEDGLKWLGIVGWFVYHTDSAFKFIIDD